MVEKEPGEPVAIPITGELDLHTFAPADIGRVVNAYLDACRAKQIYTIRVIHGKGTGTLRETVHALLRTRRDVERFNLAGNASGSWGATWVYLRRD